LGGYRHCRGKQLKTTIKGKGNYMSNINRIKKVVGVSLTASLVLLGLGQMPANAASAPTAAQIAKAMNTPTTIKFWTWVGGIDAEVKAFNAKYPKIKVVVQNVGQGGPHYQKLRAGAASGKGLPDVAQVEFQYIPTFNQIGLLADIKPYVSKDFKKKFADWTVSQVTGPKGEILAVPQDTGPMGMLYRKDIFAKYGISVPKTWDEFAAAAKKLNAADPNVYLTNFSPNEPGGFNGLGWQAGARPFTPKSASSYKISLNDAGAVKTAKYWGDLVASGAVSVDPAWNNDWYAGFNNGKYATWLTAAWGPLFLAGQAKDTSGKWAAAPLPQWKAGQNVSGNWGGSTSAVMKASKNQIAAAVFAEFINSDPSSTSILSSPPQFLFPAAQAALESEKFTADKPAFFDGQQVNKVFSEINKTVAKDFSWSPFQDQVYQEWQNTVGKAIATKGDVTAALNALQDNVVKYAIAQGFTVSK
jgi:multiple sugar transport system substrate-binding protein